MLENVINWQDTFNIEDDRRKHECMVIMDALYRGWRGHLVRQFMTVGKSPCDAYNISIEDWETFRMHETEEFEVRKNLLILIISFVIQIV